MVEAIPVLSDGEAKFWYNWTARRVGGDWIQLNDEFCLFFYPISKVIAHWKQLISFEQGDESLGVAWARYAFSRLRATTSDAGGNTYVVFLLWP